MKNINKVISLVCSIILFSLKSFADEYGYFKRNHLSSNWVPSSIDIQSNQIFILMNANRQIAGGGYSPSIRGSKIVISNSDNDGTNSISIQATGVYLNTYTPEDSRSIVGPCSIVPSVNTNEGLYIPYKIRTGDTENKAALSMNQDGSKIAIGIVDSSNTTVRTYNYDGTNWVKFGENIQ